MKKLFADLPFFVEVAKQKNFTQAADVMGIPLPTISRRIALLEKRLGIQLFNRNSRKVELTEAGRKFFTRCEFIVAETNDAIDNLRSDQKSLTGCIRIAFPATVYFNYLRGALSSFASKYPGIEMHTHFSTRWIDLYAEPFDLEIRVGSLPDSGLVVRRLFTSSLGIYASPTFLMKYGKPKNPQDLTMLPQVHLTPYPEHSLRLRNGDREETITVTPAHTVNGQAMAEEFVLAGQCISALEINSAHKYEQRNEMVRLLPEWTAPGIDVHLVRTSGAKPRRIQVFVEHLVKHFSENFNR
ncbi:MAG: LysR family transcriptional regulator [Sphingomonadaceae bacterium]